MNLELEDFHFNDTPTGTAVVIVNGHYATHHAVFEFRGHTNADDGPMAVCRLTSGHLVGRTVLVDLDDLKVPVR